jgi:leader peptidase (prepilin peptidase) / N-methyltransferase
MAAYGIGFDRHASNHSDIVRTTLTMPIFAMLAVAACIGAVIGRLLRLCIHNLPHHRPITTPLPANRRSFFVECLTAALCAAALAYYGPGILMSSRIVFGCALIVLFAIDLEHRLLPNAITLPGIAIGLLFSLAAAPGWRSSLVGIAIGGGIPLTVAAIYFRVRRREGLGMGDVKMLAMIGAFLGGPAVVVTLMISSIAGSIAGLAVIVSGRGGMQYTWPFGTFLAISGAISAVVAQPLFEWLQTR